MGTIRNDVFPRCAWYNVRHIGVSHERRLKSKLENVQTLCKRHAIVGLSELHSSEGRCQGAFVDHVSNVHPYYMQGGGDHVILVDVNFKRGFDIQHVQLVSGSSHCISWIHDGKHHVFVSFRFHPSDARIRAQQIRELKVSLRNLCGNSLRDVKLVIGGDRNFVSSEDQKQSSFTDNWHPGAGVMSAWLDLLADTNCIEHCPDEFTWKRNGSNGYVLECLDVCAHNISMIDSLDHQSTCTVSRYVPHVAASDHMPVELEFVRRRRPKIRGQLRAPAYIPAWLYSNAIFINELEQSVRDWFSSRGHGMQGLCEFAEIVQLVAKDCLEARVLVAETPGHRFDVVAAAIRCSARCNGESPHMHAIPYRKAVKYCKIVPTLDAAITWDLDLQDNTVLLDANVARDQLRAHHQEILSSQASAHNHMEDGDDDGCYGSTLQSGSCRPYTLQRIKQHLPKTMHQIVKLWDEHAQEFTYDDSRIAELLTADAMDRQGASRGDSAQGECLLRHATLDLRNVRSRIHDEEILNAILDGNASASPGPNGVRGHPYHNHASHLIQVFREAFEDIMAGADLLPPFAEGLLRPIGKTADPCTFRQIRDLELPNFDRKVLERLFCVVIDECASQSLSRSQAACVKGRDIASHVLRFSNTFEESISSDELLATLSLDCSKGFNRMSHSWVQRVLRAAGCPEFMVAAVMRMISPSVAILVHNQRRMSRMNFLCGLRQGGPLSALLYVLAVDPLLCAFRSVPHVVLVLGFVDDWLAAARSVASIALLQKLCDEFECGSGQIFNADKCVILTSRPPTAAELHALQSHWTACRVVDRHKIVGILYGARVRPEERYSEAVCKMETRIEQLRHVNMSVNMRVVTANVFLLSHLSFLNRFFMMPDSVVADVQNKVRQFITRMSIGSIKVWTHCLPIMKSKVALFDIRLQNVAMLICTSRRFVHEIDVLGTTSARWMHKCSSCMAAAHLFFYNSALRFPPSGESGGTSQIYKSLLRSEFDSARAYMRERLASRQSGPDDFLDNVDRIPASATDHHRTCTLMWALNGLATTRRVSSFRSDVLESPCKLCGAGSDSLMHLTCCPVVRDCVGAVVRQHLQLNPQDGGSVSEWAPEAHFLQGPLSATQMLLIMRVNVVVWHTRCLIDYGHAFFDNDDLRIYMARACSDPIFHKRVVKQRRPVEPPALPANAVLYRSDGAARGQGQNGQIQSGAGAVYYGAGGSIEAWISRHLDEATNNVAEYAGALLALERIERTSPAHSVLQMDSMLVTNQLRGCWRVAAPNLVPYFRQANALICRVRQRGLEIDFVHVYREHNKDADAKANQGADGTNAQHNW